MNLVDEFIEKVEKRYQSDVATDPRQKQRLAEHMCKACFYELRICGQAFTKFNCKRCNKENMHQNTCVPNLCDDCADKSVLCARCMKARD